MLKNTIVNRGVIKKIAVALGDLNERVMYVGGAVVSLYINDPAADDVRPTKDIDISLEIASLGELEVGEMTSSSMSIIFITPTFALLIARP